MRETELNSAISDLFGLQQLHFLQIQTVGLRLRHTGKFLTWLP